MVGLLHGLGASQDVQYHYLARYTTPLTIGSRSAWARIRQASFHCSCNLRRTPVPVCNPEMSTDGADTRFSNSATVETTAGP